MGGTFVLSESEHASAFELTDFILTDRLRDPSAPDPTARVVYAFKSAAQVQQGGPSPAEPSARPGGQ
ncbi:hypothetical protein GCM10009780_44700 [Actinomadura alba]